MLIPFSFEMLQDLEKHNQQLIQSEPLYTSSVKTMGDNPTPKDCYPSKAANPPKVYFC